MKVKAKPINSIKIIMYQINERDQMAKNKKWTEKNKTGVVIFMAVFIACLPFLVQYFIPINISKYKKSGKVMNVAAKVDKTSSIMFEYPFQTPFRQ